MTTSESLFIGGEWTDSAATATISVLSASTGQPIGTAVSADRADVDRAVGAARAAFDDPAGWSVWPPDERADVLERMAAELEAVSESTARTVSEQNGMPITVSTQIEAVFPVAMIRYYAGLLRSEAVETSRPGMFGGTTHVRREPAGVVAAVAPWNFPQALAAQKYAPALAAGCTVVLKPSPQTVLDTRAVAEAAMKAGVPAGVLNVLPAEADASAYLVGHPGVDMVAFTGSTAIGRQIAGICGPLIRPVILELGGRSAAVILDDADLDLGRAGEALFGSMLINNGQTCFLSTRVLAPRSRYAEVVETLAAFAGSLTVGDALEPDTQIGPLVSERQRHNVERAIPQGISDGARLVTGGARPEGLGGGWFLQPTVLADVDNRWPIAREEIFGPVLTITPYDGDEEAVALANDSDYGLAGTVWTSDVERGLDVARRIRTGTVGINGYLPDLSAPFGGVKQSGLGRELGPDGLASYYRTKSIYQR
ncbi:aldehyde dehydrogenase [Amycolatopsis thermophila]|uniref:Acyl-CoA reductase-like NAD-dependent aldehyde dehydrogenase n=1 Tax=Amycolatopsis thermophila TaxID=206084 RepID=A0ABU0F030_9PSEU|nr:aldehyde dehydrogenase [Amycolatopsis thermophila]MDQ0380929.1 acyl-CoA reductase-like NAD-dependent aldehyde dehydrogenase [Amycolatopsis thermophila]